jgi:hypothetical protein
VGDLEQHRTDATTGDVLVALGRRFQQSEIPIPVVEILQLLPMIGIAIESLRMTQFQMANRLGLAGVFCEPTQALPTPPASPGSRATNPLP